MSNNEETNSQIEIDPETGFITDSSQPATPTGPELESLTQVRDILVGPVTRDLEQGLRTLENRLEQSILEITESTASRMDDLEKHLCETVDDLKNSLGKQETSHLEQLEQSKTEHEAIVAELREQTEDLSERISGAQTEFHDELAGKIQTVKDEIERLGAKLGDDISAEAGRLRNELVDRASLATSLSEVVMRVGGPSNGMGMDPSDADFEGLLGDPVDD